MRSFYDVTAVTIHQNAHFNKFMVDIIRMRNSWDFNIHIQVDITLVYRFMEGKIIVEITQWEYTSSVQHSPFPN